MWEEWTQTKELDVDTYAFSLAVRLLHSPLIN